MTNKPREILCEFIKTYGKEIIDNPVRFRNLIKDHFLGDFKKEQKCLTDSIEEEIPNRLCDKNQQLPYNLLSPQLTQRLMNLGFSPDIAQWTVDSWALALGVITEEQLINIQTPAKKTQKSNMVEIYSNPAGATVYLNGIKQPEQTPIKVSVVSGKYKIIWKLAGYHDGEESISLKKDTPPVNFNLIKLAGLGHSVKITTSPPDADVYLDGIFKGATPLTISNVTEDTHGVRCSLSGYEDIVTQISVNTDTPLTYILTKEVPSSSLLSVSSDPIGAELYVGGKLAGKTPLDIPTVSGESYNLLFVLSGYAPYRQIISIPRSTNVNVKLSKQTHSGGNPQTQAYTQNSPDTLTQKSSGKNKGLIYWGVICFALIIVGGLIFGFISHNTVSPTNPAAVSTGVGAIIPPVINQSDTQSLQRGISLMNAGDYTEASKEFRNAVSLNPQSVSGWNYLGFSLYKLGNYNESINAFDRAISFDQNNPAILINKGNSLNLLGKYDDAIATFDRAVVIDPNNADAWKGKGISYFSLQKYSDAVNSFDKSLIIAPNDELALTYKGQSLQALERYTDAITIYDRVLELKPNDKQILLYKGDCLNSIKDYPNAIAVFDKVLSNNPTSKEAFYGKGIALLNQKTPQEALAIFNNALKIDPNYVDALVGKGNALLDLTNTFDALQMLNKALEIDPENSDAWECKGRIYESQAKYNDALQAYDQALKYNPNSMDGLMGKADVLIKMEDYNGAVVILEKAITISPNNKDLWNEKGYALIKKGENSNAEIALNKALELDPKFVSAWNNKGYALSGAGKYNQSLQAFEKAIELNPNFKDAWIGKSIVYTKMGDFQASEAAANKAISIKQ